jgi:hypothetical protein
VFVELLPAIAIPCSVGLEPAAAVPFRPWWTRPSEQELENRKHLAASGFADYNAIEVGCALYDPTQISIDDWRRIVHAHLDVSGQGPLQLSDSCALFGGCILRIDGVAKLFPQCCGTLADSLSWSQVLSSGFQTGAICSEGHPSPLAHCQGDAIVVSCTDIEEFQPPTEPEIRVAVDALAAALEHMTSALTRAASTLDVLGPEFGRRLSPVLFRGE